ncbi:VOC family protein [Candidatus Microgenomates bacterium]|nr:MAG: VOC family protein [Candidatus Microgenomates bacterium]
MFKNTKAFSSFSVDDLDAAKEFYGNTLGLDVKEIEQGLEVRISGGNPLFIYPKNNHQPATFTVLNFPVENVEKAVDALVKKGIHFEHYKEWGTNEKGIAHFGDEDGDDIAWFKDPAGNVLSVISEKK